jgi:hypothetical protein
LRGWDFAPEAPTEYRSTTGFVQLAGDATEGEAADTLEPVAVGGGEW